MGQSQGGKKTCNVELIFLVLIPRLSKKLLVSWWLESFPFIHMRCWYGWLWATWWFTQRMKLELLHLPCRAPPTSAALACPISDLFLSLLPYLTLKQKLLIYFWLCWVFAATRRLPLDAVSRGHSLVVVCGLLIAAASLVARAVASWLK